MIQGITRLITDTSARVLIMAGIMPRNVVKSWSGKVRTRCGSPEARTVCRIILIASIAAGGFPSLDRLAHT